MQVNSPFTQNSRAERGQAQAFRFLQDHRDLRSTTVNGQSEVIIEMFKKETEMTYEQTRTKLYKQETLIV